MTVETEQATIKEHWSEYFGKRYLRILAVLSDHAIMPIPEFLELKMFEIYNEKPVVLRNVTAKKA
jgi:hypothetical protein